MKKILLIASTILLAACELERVNPGDNLAPLDIQNSNVKFLKYLIASEEIIDNKITKNETVYLSINLKNYGAKISNETKVRITPINCKGTWYINDSIYYTRGPIYNKGEGELYIENPLFKYGLKFKAPNIATSEHLLLTITDNSGRINKEEMIVDVK